MSKEKKDKNNKKDKENILQKDLSAKEILAVVGVFGTIFVYGYLFIYPKYSEYKVSLSNLKSIESQVDNYEKKINEMQEKEEQLNSLKRELKVKSRMLSHNMEDGMFLIGLSKLMDSLDVDLVEYSLEDIISYDTFYAIPTTISVRGDYRNIREIMYYMEEQKNMTQILDYSMETYIPKEDKKDTLNNNTSTIIADKVVYWTQNGSAYHKESCTVLHSEKNSGEVQVLSGTYLRSNKSLACEVCKPYTINNLNTEVQEETTEPRSNGEVEAKFKFMMYSSNNPILELENDDPSKWEPGKYNPFATTSR